MAAQLNIGLLAHVDAGKTTLSEAMLYLSGAKRTLGRVDHADAYLDTHFLERQRGITIFSKQARFSTPHREFTLVDTPGHVDFCAEAERVLPVLDCAVLVISGPSGIQAHTVTLWNLLQRYNVPTVIFVSKMDLPGADKETLLAQLQQLSPGCVDFNAEDAAICESAAMCDEALLETYLETGTLSREQLQNLVAKRKLFPCCFGAGLKLEGVDRLLQVLDLYVPTPHYGDEFAARVYKISRDPQGNRLTWMKITGGSLKARSMIGEEKVIQLRLYSGDKFTTPEMVSAGRLCAATGLNTTFSGQSLGADTADFAPVLEPVMTYRVNLPKGIDPLQALPKLRLLEEEDPLLRLVYDSKGIQVQIMGKVQLEVLRSLIRERFSMDVIFDSGKIYYKETIGAPVEGIGHFEPLRHYAEVHLLLAPLPQGSGLVFDTVCHPDVLDMAYQKLILSHLAEKPHLGVLTGAPITDMKITLLVGKAHLKHTEGGDFRQATYRAVRQGLMQAQSILLEPIYRFRLQVPTAQIGRAITDIRAMSGQFDAPEALGDDSLLVGTVPASELGDYAETLASYTQGKGQLQVTLDGYAPCHNQDTIVAEAGYDPEADLENTPDSVFCSHGAGFTVKWNQVQDYMHLESGIAKKPPEPELITRNIHLEDKELDAILKRQFGDLTTPLYRTPANRPATESVSIRPPKDQLLIVDGYNIIFAWEDLSETAKTDLEAARRQLCDRLSSYAGYRKIRVVLVFDGYKRKGNPGEKTQYHNIQLVYTQENETADAYIEALCEEIGKNYAVRVATSDALVQLSSLRSGVLRMSARELRQLLDEAHKEMQQHFRK